MNILFSEILYYAVKNEKIVSTIFTHCGNFYENKYPIKFRLCDFPTSLANTKCTSNIKRAPKEHGHQGPYQQKLKDYAWGMQSSYRHVLS